MTEALKGHLAMLLFSLLVAGSFSLGSMAAPHISPVALNAVRFLIATIILGAVVVVTGGVPRSATHALWRYVLLAVVFTTYFVLMFEGLKTGDPVSMSAVFTLTPAMSGFFGYLILRQLTTPRMALALGCGALGAFWVIFRADFENLLSLQMGKGELIFFWGCVAHSIYPPLVRKLNRGESALVFTFGMLVAGTAILFVYGAVDILNTAWLALPAIVWIAIVYTAVASSAMTFVLLQFATLRIPSAKAMAYTYLTPSWVILLEFSLGRDLPPPLILVGIALTILALILLLKNEEPAARAA